MKNWWIAIPIVVVFALSIWGAYFLYQRRVAEVAQEPFPDASPVAGFDTLTASPSPGVLGSINQQQSTGTSPNSQPATGPTNETNVVLNEPKEFSTISSPTIISGWTKISQNHLTVVIKDASEHILAKTSVNTCPNFEVCSFNTQLNFQSPTTPTGSIQIFANSNSENLKIIPVSFKL